MPTYKYEAMDTSGGEVKGQVVGVSEDEAQQKIRQMGYFITKITEVPGMVGTEVGGKFKMANGILLLIAGALIIVVALAIGILSIDWDRDPFERLFDLAGAAHDRRLPTAGYTHDGPSYMVMVPGDKVRGFAKELSNAAYGEGERLGVRDQFRIDEITEVRLWRYGDNYGAHVLFKGEAGKRKPEARKRKPDEIHSITVYKNGALLHFPELILTLNRQLESDLEIAPGSPVTLADKVRRLWSRLEEPRLDAYSETVLVVVVVGMIVGLIAQARFRHAPPDGSGFTLFFKMWHYPAIVVANVPSWRFLRLAFLILASLTLLGVAGAAGYVVGALAGKAGSIVAAVVSLFLAILLIEVLLREIINDTYLTDLRHDVLTSSPLLRTMDGQIVFPVLCMAQTLCLFGVAGGILGDLISLRAVDPLHTAIVATFAACLFGNVLAYAKRNTSGGGRRAALAILQGVSVTVLLLPAKKLLAEQQVTSAIFEFFTKVFGGEMGLDAVLVAAGGFFTTVANALSKER